MNKLHVIIIGGGIGGLCSGLRLLHAGYSVSLYEERTETGGVIQSLPSLTGYPDYDSFASIGIHPNTYRKIFTDIGLNYKDYFSEIYLDDLYRIFYEDGSSFTLSKDPTRGKYTFEAFYNESFDKYNAFVHQFYQKYLIADALLLSQPLTHLNDILNYTNLSSLLSLNPIVSAAFAIKHHISSLKLRDFLLFQTYYMGFPPSSISQLYATIPACTQIDGLVHIKGGMGAYAKALQKAFVDCGGKLYCNKAIRKILTSKGTAYGVLTESKSIQKADIIISDADYHYTCFKLLDPPIRIKKPLLPLQMTCSVFMLRLTLSIKLTMLSTHNVFLVKDTERSFSTIAKGHMPLHFPMYLYYPSHVDEHFNTSHSTTLNIMVRVPNLSDAPSLWSPLKIQKMRTLCLTQLADLTGIKNISSYILHEAISTPHDLAQDYHYYQGAAFGLAPSFLQSAWLHPQPISTSVKNLYFTGTSIHPGNGISIVMKGAETVSFLIQKSHPIKK